jgi:VIT1/CCC1 family predicted Fe2+/Mn2+ transporter
VSGVSGAGLATYIGFMLAGLVPLLPYIFQAVIPVMTIQPFLWSIILAGLTFSAIGAAKARFVDQHWYLGRLETLVIGGIAAGLAYVIGALLRGMADAV